MWFDVRRHADVITRWCFHDRRIALVLGQRVLDVVLTSSRDDDVADDKSDANGVTVIVTLLERYAMTSEANTVAADGADVTASAAVGSGGDAAVTSRASIALRRDDAAASASNNLLHCLVVRLPAFM